MAIDARVRRLRRRSRASLSFLVGLALLILAGGSAGSYGPAEGPAGPASAPVVSTAGLPDGAWASGGRPASAAVTSPVDDSRRTATGAGPAAASLAVLAGAAPPADAALRSGNPTVATADAFRSAIAERAPPARAC